MQYKVMKGPSKRKSELDSTWPDKSRAEDRAKTLRGSLRKGVVGKRILVWTEPCTEDDPKNYRKPIKGPYTNYDAPSPSGKAVIKKGYARPRK